MYSVSLLSCHRWGMGWLRTILFESALLCFGCQLKVHSYVCNQCTSESQRSYFPFTSISMHAPPFNN
ncbi:hypothetical protein GLYMA_12G065301v4 [Glycine max]|nr:hypothetical protein GLYMA_12G065301v4 [Glycine max]KAH1141930.1 hypothetical protein GYH30_032899 [Glycine max]